ncbi:PepSY-associated TM helix domain-containing protein [Pseudomonas typographi]|uniref:PepSY domain-containing protein n=1 Tax=Pseudomonas typographi TaxID=2715964 RepID=A0ABR7Z709_9PSED|nr:PepSY domain-containing protein [Pseudomonas typographi]MBD1601113.1 PepSY domain-containing protein [Pseudomonas typographi]
MPAISAQRTAWAALLKRLHFYIGLFVGPFLLVAALSGVLYALTPQLENWLYASALHTDARGPALTLARQVRLAQARVGDNLAVAAVRPAVDEGSTTRVMFSAPGYGASEHRAVFIDPVNGEVRGDMAVYGTSGVLPLRTWLDQFHRGLLLGDVGRLYSELAASWLWVAALGGVWLWWQRPGAGRQGGLRGLHASSGLWLLLGFLFFSATGLTWSQYAGGNIGVLRAQFGWATPSVNTQLGHAHGGTAMGGEHAEHHMAMDGAPMALDPQVFDQVLAAARAAGIDASKVEIRPALAANTAWVVNEIDRSWPTQVDAVALDPSTLEIVGHTEFARFPLAAKLTRWGIDAHMGTLFGLANQLLLVTTGLGLSVMVVLGYLMWWRRRPALGHGPTLLASWRQLPGRGRLAVVAAAGLFGLCLPVMGASLVLLLAFDAGLSLRQRGVPAALAP